MSKTKSTTPKTPPPTVVTLTLPESDTVPRSGTLLIQRGDLAHVRQFQYSDWGDFPAILAEAAAALVNVEANPPAIPEPPPPAPKSEPKHPTQAADQEPTIDIPLKKGTKTVKISHLKIISGETDAAAYRQAVLIAGRLIDGKLWDGNVPLRLNDVNAIAHQLKHLTDRDLSLYTLADFAQVGGEELRADTPDPATLL